MLLALASAVFLGSESLRTRDHILMSQIWDFPFRRLLPLTASRWRYSTPATQSQNHIATDGQSISQSVLVSSPHLGLKTRSLLLFDTYSPVIVGRPLWREDGLIPEEIGHLPQRDDPPCESGTAQGDHHRENLQQGQRGTRNLERMDAQEETAGATAE
jgi:hypothetical protein